MGQTDCGGNSGLVLMCGAMLSKSLIQFSVDGRGCVPFLLFGLRVGIKRTYASTVVFSAPTPWQATVDPRLCWRLLDSQASLGQSLVGSLHLSPGSWCAQVLFVPSKSLFPQSCASSVIKSHWPPKSNSLGKFHPFARSPGWEICCGS